MNNPLHLLHNYSTSLAFLANKVKGFSCAITLFLSLFYSATLLPAATVQLVVYDHTATGSTTLPQHNVTYTNRTQSFDATTFAPIIATSYSADLFSGAYNPWNLPTSTSISVWQNATFDDASMYIVHLKFGKIYRKTGIQVTQSWNLPAGSKLIGQNFSSTYINVATAVANGKLYVMSKNVTAGKVSMLEYTFGTTLVEKEIQITLGVTDFVTSYGGFTYGGGSLWLLERGGFGHGQRVWQLSTAGAVQARRNLSLGIPTTSITGHGLAYYNSKLYLMDIMSNSHYLYSWTATSSTGTSSKIQLPVLQGPTLPYSATITGMSFRTVP